MGSHDNRDKIDQLFPELYAELRRIAGSLMRSERPNHSLSPTALVHEAYLRLADRPLPGLDSRTRFLAVAARCMRRILVDYARKHRARKRGGSAFIITFDEELHARQVDSNRLIDLDEALHDLQKKSARQAAIIEQWFFGGLQHVEIAAELGVSLPTVRRDWRLARAWLARRLTEKEPGTKRHHD